MYGHNISYYFKTQKYVESKNLRFIFKKALKKARKKLLDGQ